MPSKDCLSDSGLISYLHRGGNTNYADAAVHEALARILEKLVRIEQKMIVFSGEPE